MPDYIRLAYSLEVRLNLHLLKGQWPGKGRQKKSNTAGYFEILQALVLICSRNLKISGLLWPLPQELLAGQMG